MKFKITMKDPDGFGNSLADAVADGNDGTDVEAVQEELEKLTSKWFEYSEYVTIEIDTDTGTARVCEVEK